MRNHDQDADPDTHRIDGQLHSVHHIKDEEGKIIKTVTQPLKVEFHLADLGQLIAGACVMALPVALTEEVWNLGESLSQGRVLLVLAVSILTLAGFIWGLFYGQRVGRYKGHFLARVTLAYGVTFCVSLGLLVLFDRAPMEDLEVAFARTILVAFPASFAATVVDFIK